MSAFCSALLQAAQLVVGPGAFPGIGPAIDAALPGDTILVSAGIHSGPIEISKPVVLIGQPGAVIYGQGRGTVLLVSAPTTVRGLTIRSSGADQSREDAGIMVVGAEGVVLEDNRLEDVLFGIYLKQAPGAVVRRNSIRGKALPPARRGDGIRLWYSDRGLVEDNDVTDSRDLVIWFSSRTLVRNNQVTASRYGLHYMYSNHNRFESNRFVGNQVGAFIMYSGDIFFEGNLFAESRGTFGRGIGFKDADSIVAANNIVVNNAIGISLDNSPNLDGVFNRFTGNLIAYNDVGISLLPSVSRNLFHGNRLVDNIVPVQISGGGTALGNFWRGNYWSEYAGFDQDADGYGDTPFSWHRLSDDLTAKHPELRWFTGSLAFEALNLFARAVPLLLPQPVVIDSTPLTKKAAGSAAYTHPQARDSLGAIATAAVAFLAGIAPAAYVRAKRRRIRHGRSP
jgi:nitrous oxidase accessory protein